MTVILRWELHVESIQGATLTFQSATRHSAALLYLSVTLSLSRGSPIDSSCVLCVCVLHMHSCNVYASINDVLEVANPFPLPPHYQHAPKGPVVNTVVNSVRTMKCVTT